MTLKYFNRNVSTLDDRNIGYIVKETKNQIVVFGKGNKRYDIPVWKIKTVNNNVLIDMDMQAIEDSYTMDRNAPLPSSSNDGSPTWQSISNTNLDEYEEKYITSLVNKSVKTKQEEHVGYVLKEEAEKIIIISNDDKENIRYEIPESKIFTVGLDVMLDVDITSLAMYKVDQNTSLLQ